MRRVFVVLLVMFIIISYLHDRFVSWIFKRDFSNSLIIHQDKTKQITTVKEV